MSEQADWIEIRTLCDRYSTSVTTGDLAGIASVFASDAEWHVDAPFNINIIGNEKIAQGLGALIATQSVVIQMLHSSVINIHGDHATSQCVVQEIASDKDGKGGGNILYGVYDDQIARINGRWQFIRRHFQPLLVEPKSPAGNVYQLKNKE